MDRTLRLLVVIFLAVVLLGTLTGITASAPPGSARTLSVDDAMKELDLIRPWRQKLAQDFGLPRLDHRTFTLNEHRGKIVFVNFWATWCAPCREEMPAMERLWRRHKDRGFVIVAVSVDADPTVVAPFVKQLRLTFPIVLDPRMPAANTYGARALPSSFLVDRKGYVTALALGPRAWDTDAAHALIEGLVQ